MKKIKKEKEQYLDDCKKNENYWNGRKNKLLLKKEREKFSQISKL